MSDLDKMQADAVNRAREMYSRRSPVYSANGFPNGYNGNMKTNPNSPNSTAERKHVQAESPPKNQAAEHSEPEHKAEEKPPKKSDEDLHNENREFNRSQSGDFLDTVLADKEKALIILLIALLNEEKASSSLLLALMYLII